MTKMYCSIAQNARLAFSNHLYTRVSRPNRNKLQLYPEYTCIFFIHFTATGRAVYGGGLLTAPCDAKTVVVVSQSIRRTNTEVNCNCKYCARRTAYRSI